MSSERWRLVERLYHDALERPAAERTAFLAEACAGDEALGSDVRSLLEQPSMPGFLEEPALAVAAALAAAETPEPSWIGRHIGVYHLQSLLGRGGMGEVYRAHDTRLGRDVALKLLPPGFTADAERLARFTREARLLASLNHPNIGTIHGFEEAEGVRALVLELVEGDTLADRVARGPVPVPETLAIARQIADALEAAHDKGVVHRDLKPANIKITPDGVIKVLDFGLAKSDPGGAPELANSPTITIGGTVAGLILGTAAYMSPEQARGRAVDKRADVWAFGCVLYELLTGRQAFPGETVSDTIGAILNREPDWNELPRDLPPGVMTLLRRCLEKDAKKRKRDIGDARAEIDDALARPAADRAAGGASKASTAVVGRHSVVPWVVAAAGLIAAAVAWWPGTAAWQNPLADGQFTLADAKFRQLTDFPGIETDAVISSDGRFVAFVSDRDGPLDIFLTQVDPQHFRNLTRAPTDDLDNLGSVRSLGFTGDGSEIWLRGTRERRMQLMPLFGPPRPFLGERVLNAAWSPDGTRLVYQKDGDGDPLFIADRNGSNPTKIFESGHNHGPAWATDSQWIYFIHGQSGTREVWRIRPSGGKPEVMLQQTGYVLKLAPLDSRTILYAGYAEDGAGPWLWALDVETRTSRRVSWSVEQYTSIAASGDGRRLVATVAKPRASLWSVPIGGQTAGPADTRPYEVPAVRAWGPRVKGRSLFYLSAQGTGDGLWRYRDGQSAEIWRGSQGGLSGPAAVSPDGLQAAIVLRKGGRRTLTLVEMDGSQSRTLAGEISIVGSPDWSPDGSWVVAAGDDGHGRGLFKIPVAGGAPIRLVSGEVDNPSWSPKDDLILYMGRNVGAQAPLLGVGADGGKVALPVVETTGEDLRFLPDGSGAVFVRGGFGVPRTFWLLELPVKNLRRLMELPADPKLGAMRRFDITADGKQIIFDRTSDNSDIVLIDLPRRQ